MTFKYRYKKQIISVSIIFIIIVISIFNIYKINKEKIKKDKNIVLTNTKKEKIEKKEKKPIIEEYMVDIKGEVNVPGIYKLNKDSRIIDVINLAGGLTSNSDTSVINLSKKINDEMVIIIYSKEEVKEFAKTKEIENKVLNECYKQKDTNIVNNACIDSTKNIEENKQISLNNATIEELMTLNGIGEQKAKDIIEYREQNNGFKDIEEIKNIKGIGDSLFAKIKENITL